LSSDLDYGERTPFFRLAELSWWVIVVPVVAGLIQLRRGHEPQALLLLGLCGALQFYNVCYYMAYGGIVENFDNVASDSILAPLLYWILNVLWGLAGGIAAVLAFRLLFHRYVPRS
jgi:ABC-type Co2+ transport system permease subunit